MSSVGLSGSSDTSMNQVVPEHHHTATAITDKGLKMKIKRKGVGAGKGEKAKKSASNTGNTKPSANAPTAASSGKKGGTSRKLAKKTDKKADKNKSKLVDDSFQNGADNTDCEGSSVDGDRPASDNALVWTDVTRREDSNPGTISNAMTVGSPPGVDAWENLKRRVSGESGDSGTISSGATPSGVAHGKHDDDPYDFNVKTNDIIPTPHSSYQNAKKQKITKTSSSSSVSPVVTSAIGPLPGPLASTVTSPALPQATATPLVTIPCLPSSSPTCDVSVETCNVGVVTEPECLGPCDPGTCVNLEGIVWHESHNGMLVINVTWRNKTYVGTLMDATKYDWAPPRPSTDSPTSDIETGSRGGRGKRRAAMNMDSSMHERRLRNGKRSQQAIFNAPPSPAKSDASNSSSKRRKPVHDSQEADAPSNKRSKVASDADNHKPVKDENDLYECDRENCSKKYKSISALRYHQSNNHSNDNNDSKKKDTKPKPKGKAKAKKAKRQTDSVSEDCEQDRSLSTTPPTPMEAPAEPMNITYQLSAQTTNGTTIVTSPGSAQNGTVVGAGASRVATATTVNIPVATPQTVNVLRVTSPTVTSAKKSKKTPHEVRPIKTLTSLPTPLSAGTAPVTVSASAAAIVGGAALKPIQPKPTVMGVPVASNPMIGKSKDKKIKKKKSKDKDKSVKDGKEAVSVIKEASESSPKATTDVTKGEENNNKQDNEETTAVTDAAPAPLSNNAPTTSKPSSERKCDVPASESSRPSAVQDASKVPAIDNKHVPSPTKPLTIPNLPNGVRHDPFIRIGKFAYAADPNHHQYLMNMDISYRKQYETMLREHPHVPGNGTSGNVQQKDTPSPTSQSGPGTPTNGTTGPKHSNMPSLKPPQLISSYQSVSSPNSTKNITVKDEPSDSKAATDEKAPGMLYERQKEDLQRFYMYQQQRLLEQQRQSEKKASMESHKPLNLSSPSPRSELKSEDKPTMEKINPRDHIKTEKDKSTPNTPSSTPAGGKDIKPDIKHSPKPGETPPGGLPSPYGYFYPPGLLPSPQSPYASPFDPYRQPHHPVLNYGAGPFPLPSDAPLISPGRTDVKSPAEKPPGSHAALERLQKHASQYYKTAATSNGAPPSGLAHKIHELTNSDAAKTSTTPPTDEKKPAVPSVDADGKPIDPAQPLHHLHTHHHTHVVRPGFPLPYEPYPGVISPSPGSVPATALPPGISPK